MSFEKRPDSNKETFPFRSTKKYPKTRYTQVLLDLQKSSQLEVEIYCLRSSARTY